METRRRSRPTGPGVLVGLFLTASLLTACIGGATPAAASPATSSPSASAPVQTLEAATLAPAATIVTVAWGRIWDQLPAGFPLPSDAQPAQPGDPAEGPASGVYTTGLGVDDAAHAIQAGLMAAGWSLEATTSGEDGSRDISAASGSQGCKSRVTVRPLGSAHFVTVYYGASCPRP